MQNNRVIYIDVIDYTTNAVIMQKTSIKMAANMLNLTYLNIYNKLFRRENINQVYFNRKTNKKYIFKIYGKEIRTT